VEGVLLYQPADEKPITLMQIVFYTRHAKAPAISGAFFSQTIIQPL